MKNLWHAILSGVLLAAVAIVLLGCVTGRTDLSRGGLISIETVSSDEVDILSAGIWQTEDEVLVYDTLRRRVFSTHPLAVHIHAVVHGPDGAVLEETRTPDLFASQRRHGRHTRWQRFRAPVAAVPPQGSTVILSPHSVHQTRSCAGSNPIPGRSTGSTLAYISFVSCGGEVTPEDESEG